jgi:hypothetical protein
MFQGSFTISTRSEVLAHLFCSCLHLLSYGYIRQLGQKIAEHAWAIKNVGELPKAEILRLCFYGLGSRHVNRLSLTLARFYTTSSLALNQRQHQTVNRSKPDWLILKRASITKYLVDACWFVRYQDISIYYSGNRRYLNFTYFNVLYVYTRLLFYRPALNYNWIAIVLKPWILPSNYFRMSRCILRIQKVSRHIRKLSGPLFAQPEKQSARNWMRTLIPYHTWYFSPTPYREFAPRLFVSFLFYYDWGN